MEKQRLSKPRLSKTEIKEAIQRDSDKVIRVLVCGGRDFKNNSYTKEQVYAKLHELRTGYFADYNMVVIEGWAEGADLAAAEWAEASHIPFFSFPANWKEYDKDAGAIRNGLMLAIGRPHVVVAFPGGTGTNNMIQQAKEACIETIEIDFEPT